MQQPDWRGRGARRPAIEPRKKSSSGCRRVSDRGRQHGRARERACPDGPAWSETLACADALCAGTGRSRVWPMTQRDRGPQREGEEPSPLMYGREKSDLAIVATKPTNNGRRLAAELVERRAGAEGNVSQQSTRRAQDRESVSQALVRVRQVARQRRKDSKAKKEGEVHRALPPSQYPNASGSIPRSEARCSARGRWADMAGLRDGPRSSDRGLARSGPSGSVSGATVTAPAYPEAGRSPAPFSDSRPRGQDCPKGDGSGAERDLRGGIPRVLVWISTPAQPARRAGRAGGRHHPHQGELHIGRRSFLEGTA